METLKNNWLLILGGFLAWRWYLANKAGVPFIAGLIYPFAENAENLRHHWEVSNPVNTGVTIPLPGGATATIEGEIVKIL